MGVQGTQAPPSSGEEREAGQVSPGVGRQGATGSSFLLPQLEDLVFVPCVTPNVSWPSARLLREPGLR